MSTPRETEQPTDEIVIEKTTSAKPTRRAEFDLSSIINAPDYSRVLRWEALGRKYNPDGTKLPLTVDRVRKMMRDKQMPPRRS